MASFVPICDICMTNNLTKYASVWCLECEEAICNDCKSQHDRMVLTKNHKTIHIPDYQKSPSSIPAIKKDCIHHSLKFDFYCFLHNEPCCVSCVAEKHGACQKIKPLSEVVEGVKSSAAFLDLEDRAKDICTLIGDLIREKQKNRASLRVRKDEIICEVKNVRTTINNHLLKLEKDLLDKLDNMEKKQNGIIDDFIEKLSEMRNKVQNICGDLEKTKQHESNFQTFLCIHEWNKRIEVEETNWMSFQTDQIMNAFDILVEISPILITFENDVKELGKLDLKSLSSKKILLKKEKQGQIFVSVSKTVDKIKLKNICSFETPNGESSDIFITGIDMFDDGRIVIADQSPNKRLFIVNNKGKHIKTIILEDQCYNVAVIDKNKVASTLVFKRKVIIVNVNSSKVRRTIPTKDDCYGIICTSEQLVVSLINKTIQFFDLTGNSLSTLSTVRNSIFCSVFNGKLYYTAHTYDAVYSTELNGKVLWKFDCQKSDYPAGITNDASGNIFVACSDSNQLMAMGNDGRSSKIVLTKEDGLKNPYAVKYNRKNNTLLVCNISGQCFLYNVSN